MAGTIYYENLLPALSRIGQVTIDRSGSCLIASLVTHTGAPWNWFRARIDVDEDRRLSKNYAYYNPQRSDIDYVLEDLYEKLFDYYWELDRPGGPDFYVPQVVLNYAKDLCDNHFPEMQDLSDS